MWIHGVISMSIEHVILYGNLSDRFDIPLDDFPEITDAQLKEILEFVVSEREEEQAVVWKAIVDIIRAESLVDEDSEVTPDLRLVTDLGFDGI